MAIPKKEVVSLPCLFYSLNMPPGRCWWDPGLGASRGSGGSGVSTGWSGGWSSGGCSSWGERSRSLGDPVATGWMSCSTRKSSDQWLVRIEWGVITNPKDFFSLFISIGEITHLTFLRTSWGNPVGYWDMLNRTPCFACQQFFAPENGEMTSSDYFQEVNGVSFVASLGCLEEVTWFHARWFLLFHDLRTSPFSWPMVISIRDRNQATSGKDMKWKWWIPGPSKGCQLNPKGWWIETL